MTARAKRSWKLRCPQCGRSGEVRFSQADGWALMPGNDRTTIEYLPSGFVRVDRETILAADLDILCADHRISALVLDEA